MASRVEPLADGSDLAKRALDELLPTEPRMNAHHEREIHEVQVREDRFDRGLRIEGEPGPDTASANRCERSPDIR